MRGDFKGLFQGTEVIYYKSSEFGVRSSENEIRKEVRSREHEG